MAGFVSGIAYRTHGGRPATQSRPQRVESVSVRRVASYLDYLDVLERQRIWNKMYQLEELEDREHHTTALYLKSDGTMEFGDTTGPVPKTITGTWQVNQDTNAFTMSISRTFEQDNRALKDYSISREFEGYISKERNSDIIQFDGTMLDGNDIHCGYFKLFQATDDLPSYNFRAL